MWAKIPRTSSLHQTQNVLHSCQHFCWVTITVCDFKEFLQGFYWTRSKWMLRICLTVITFWVDFQRLNKSAKRASFTFSTSAVKSITVILLPIFFDNFIYWQAVAWFQLLVCVSYCDQSSGRKRSSISKTSLAFDLSKPRIMFDPIPWSVNARTKFIATNPALRAR